MPYPIEDHEYANGLLGLLHRHNGDMSRALSAGAKLVCSDAPKEAVEVVLLHTYIKYFDLLDPDMTFVLRREDFDEYRAGGDWPDDVEAAVDAVGPDVPIGQSFRLQTELADGVPMSADPDFAGFVVVDIRAMYDDHAETLATISFRQWGEFFADRNLEARN